MECDGNTRNAFLERVCAVIFGFAAVNVAFMIAVGNSMFGPMPWAVYCLLFLASIVAALATPVFWAMARGWGLKLFDLIVWEACLITLVWFNFWCLDSALAAV